MGKKACQPLSCKCGKKIIPQYYIVAILGLFTKICFFGTRVSISILTADFVAKENLTKDPLKTYCPKTVNNTKVVSGKNYTYTDFEQGFIDASFYIGYIITHLPSGILSDYFGGRLILIAALIFSSICTLLLPFMVSKGDFGWIISSRLVIGFGHGFHYPALSAILSRWIPIKRRAFLGTLVMTGTIFGLIVGSTGSRLLMGKY